MRELLEKIASIFDFLSTQTRMGMVVMTGVFFVSVILITL
jgi:hypothetical protein